MATPQLLDYITKRMRAGANRESIRIALLEAGWKRKDVDNAFRKMATRPGGSTVRSARRVPVFAGFWRRFAAYLIDAVVIFLFELAALIVIMIQTDALKAPFALSLQEWSLAILILPLIFFLYFVLMESSSKQGTLGKMILGIRVTDAQGRPVSLFRAAARNLAKIFSAAPFYVGFLLAGFTRKKQALHDMLAGCTVVRHGESYFWSTVFGTAICFMLFLGGAGAYIHFKAPAVKQRLFETMMALSNGPAVPRTASLRSRKLEGDSLPQDVVTQGKAPMALTEARYDQLLSSQSIAFDSGVTASAGPVAFRLSNFWGQNREAPSVWIEVRLARLPNFDLNGNLARVTIDHLWDKNRRDIYQRNSGLETEFFQKLSFTERERPYPHLAAIRNVHLLPGTTEDLIGTVEGKIILKLPVQMEVIHLDMEDPESKATNSGIGATVTNVNGNDVAIEYRGPFDHYIATLAYNEAGEQVGDAGSSWSTDENRNITNFVFHYEEQVKRADLIVASRIAERAYPFVLRKE